MARPRKYHVTATQLLTMYEKYGHWDLVAKELGIGRTTLFYRIKELNLKKTYTD